MDNFMQGDGDLLDKIMAENGIDMKFKKEVKEEEYDENEMEDEGDDYEDNDNKDNKDNIKKESTYKVEIDEYFNFSNIIPINVITVKKINEQLYVLLDFEHYVTKNRLIGFFKSSLFHNFYPKMLIDFYENNLEDNY